MPKGKKKKPEIWTYSMEQMSYPDVQAMLKTTDVVLIPIAAGVLYPFEMLPHFMRQLHPMLAALAMAVSSITVISNSLLLYRKKML